LNLAQAGKKKEILVIVKHGPYLELTLKRWNLLVLKSSLQKTLMHFKITAMLKVFTNLKERINKFKVMLQN